MSKLLTCSCFIWPVQRQPSSLWMQRMGSARICISSSGSGTVCSERYLRQQTTKTGGALPGLSEGQMNECHGSLGHPYPDLIVKYLHM
ncbi:hypothetical protein EYF80_027689 [Liparis tanakae]|uniref:Uncharacterized protein n=1 Tax=Liparis tanakae TaxID=230148 RepID=A0A4Z2H855_9TELE|nr:hypothetical protein EYF80_027689 [Liparis tanakae]